MFNLAEFACRHYFDVRFVPAADFSNAAYVLINGEQATLI